MGTVLPPVRERPPTPIKTIPTVIGDLVMGITATPTVALIGDQLQNLGLGPLQTVIMPLNHRHMPLIQAQLPKIGRLIHPQNRGQGGTPPQTAQNPPPIPTKQTVLLIALTKPTTLTMLAPATGLTALTDRDKIQT